MLGLKILFFIIAVFFILVFLVAFMNSVSKERQITDRYIDALIGVIVFLMFIILLKIFGGLLWSF